ncbi:MAG: hypothetical protein PHV60_06550 [bacterium]|nr:hypothetical protein [bacterium]
MNADKIAKEAKTIVIANLSLGTVLLVTGIILNVLAVIQNAKAVVALSFIPFGIALTYFVKLWMLTRSPEKIRSIIIHETDERLVALKNEADATTFRILKWTLFLTYMGYTLMVPEDIFESIGWWILLTLLFVAFFLQGILYKSIMDKNTPKE